MVDTALDKFVNDMMQSLHCSAHVKDLQTGKYLCSNLVNSRKFGFNSAEEIVGATIYDLDDFMRPFWGNTILPDILRQEREIMFSGKLSIDKDRAFLTKDGFVCVHYMTKIPLQNKNGIISRLFTMSENVTSDLTLEQLWILYKKFYPVNKPTAIKKFLYHTGILQFFNEFPSEAEIKILIARDFLESYKAIANVLNISSKTVEFHIGNLKRKTKGVDLPLIVHSMKITDPHFFDIRI